MHTKSHFVTLISPDGGGKDTLFNEIIKEYPKAIPMYEPGGTKEADIIRWALLDAEATIEERIERLNGLIGGNVISESCQIYLMKSVSELSQNGLTGLAEAYLYAASRAETNRKIIIPTLEEGGMILSRRSVACSMSYQGHARNLGMDTIWSINQDALRGAYPTLEIYIDVPAEIAQERLKGRTEKQDRLDNEKMDFHQRTVEGYRTYYQQYCPYPYIMVDGTKSKEELLNEVREIIINHLKTA